MSVPRARRLRKEQSLAERRLWQTLRNRKLEGAKIRRQVPIGPYIADFACFENWLVIEIDGAAHRLPGRAERDAARQAWIELQGFCVLRFGDLDVVNELDSVIHKIGAALAE